MDVEVISDGERLGELKPQWDALLAASARPRPSLTHEWLTASLRHFHRGNGLAVVCFRDGQRLVGIAPLRASSTKLAGIPLMRKVEFAVGVADCRDLVVEQGAEWQVVEALYEWLGTDSMRWDMLRLRGLCSRCPTHDYLPLLATHAGYAAAAWRTAPCANVTLPTSMETFLEQMPSHRRRQVYLQKGRKLAREHGAPELRIASGVEVTKADLDRLCDLHHGSWQKRGGSGVMTGTFCGFVQDLTEAMAPTGQPMIAFLRLGDVDVAAQYGFLLNGRFFLYVVGFDVKLASYSIGAQALLALVEYGIGQGWTEIDLMSGGERYKFDFTRSCCRATDVWIAKSARRLQAACAMASLRGRTRL